MKKINPIDTHSLTNGAHYNFMEAIYTNLNSILLYGEKLSTELPAFKTALDNEDAVLVLSRKSNKTDEIANADKARDNAYVGYKYTVKGFTYLGSGAQYEAAKVLTQHLTDYQIDTQMSLSRQTGLMTNLIEDLESTYSEQIESLGLTPFVTMMKNGNEKVKSGLQSRDNERAGQPCSLPVLKQMLPTRASSIKSMPCIWLIRPIPTSTSQQSTRSTHRSSIIRNKN